MQNLIDSKMGEQRAKDVTTVLKELGLRGLRVFHDQDLKQYRFVQDRHVVKVPEVLIQKQAWSDVRFLFRAILGSSPSLNNTGSPNDWGAELSYSEADLKDPVRG